MSKQATPNEAEELAKTAVTNYLNSCRISDKNQISNYLMNLCRQPAEPSLALLLRLGGRCE